MKKSFARTGAIYNVISSTPKIVEQFKILRGDKIPKRDQYPHHEPRASHGEEAFAIMCDGLPAILFKTSKDGERLTLQVIESLPNSGLKGGAFEIVLKEVEEQAKNKGDVQLIVIDRPVDLPHVNEQIALMGYVSKRRDDDPRKTL